jgi:hypothetical protein
LQICFTFLASSKQSAPITVQHAQQQQQQQQQQQSRVHSLPVFSPELAEPQDQSEAQITEAQLAQAQQAHANRSASDVDGRPHHPDSEMAAASSAGDDEQKDRGDGLVCVLSSERDVDDQPDQSAILLD